MLVWCASLEVKAAPRNRGCVSKNPGVGFGHRRSPAGPCCSSPVGPSVSQSISSSVSLHSSRVNRSLLTAGPGFYKTCSEKSRERRRGTFRRRSSLAPREWRRERKYIRMGGPVHQCWITAWIYPPLPTKVSVSYEVEFHFQQEWYFSLNLS